MSKAIIAGGNVTVDESVRFRRPHLVTLGSFVQIDPFVYVSTGLQTGSYVHIAAHTGIIGGEGGRLQMGNFTNISLGGRIICGSDNFKGDGLIHAPGIPEDMGDSLTVEPVIFDDYVNLGASVTILPGVHLPTGCVIGAGSLVRKNDHLEEWTIYAGNPLRKVRERPRDRMIEYGSTLLKTLGT